MQSQNNFNNNKINNFNNNRIKEFNNKLNKINRVFLFHQLLVRRHKYYLLRQKFKNYN